MTVDPAQVLPWSVFLIGSLNLCCTAIPARLFFFFFLFFVSRSGAKDFEKQTLPLSAGGKTVRAH